MRFALLLRGIAFCGNYRHPSKNIMMIDYKKSIENYKDYIFKNNNVDVFYHTYYSGGLNIGELNAYLNPKAYSITMDHEDKSIPNVHKYQSSVYSLMSVLNLFNSYVLTNKCEYDYIIVTRFDLLFKLNIDQLILEKDTFMISCMTENPRLMDDNFFMSGPELFKKFLYILCFRDNSKMLHFDYESVCANIGVDKVRTLIPGNYVISHGTPLYSIVRHRMGVDIYNFDGNFILFNAKSLKYISSNNKNIILSTFPSLFRFVKNENFYNIMCNDLFLSHDLIYPNDIIIEKTRSNPVIRKRNNGTYMTTHAYSNIVSITFIMIKDEQNPESYFLKTEGDRYLSIVNGSITMRKLKNDCFRDPWVILCVNH